MMTQIVKMMWLSKFKNTEYVHKSSTGLGTVGQALEKSENEVLDIWILFSPHVNGSFLEERFLLGVVQSPHQSVSPEFRVFLTIVEDGEEVVADGKLIFLKKRLETAHGGITDSTVLVLVLNNIQENFGGSWVVDVLEGNNGLGLFFESGGGSDPVREDLDVLVQKSSFLATSFLAGTAEKGSESKLNDATTVLANSGLAEKGLEFYEKIFSWVTDVVGQRSDNASNDDGFGGLLNNVTNDKGRWSSSSNDQSIQKEFTGEQRKITIKKLFFMSYEPQVSFILLKTYYSVRSPPLSCCSTCFKCV